MATSGRKGLMTTGSVCTVERSGGDSTARSPEVVDIVRKMFPRSPERTPLERPY